jgi:hypothetical protein
MEGSSLQQLHPAWPCKHTLSFTYKNSGISTWVSQNVLRRGIRTIREHLPIGLNHVLEFAQELQVHIG